MLAMSILVLNTCFKILRNFLKIK